MPFKVSIEGPTKSNVTVNYATSNGVDAEPRDRRQRLHEHERHRSRSRRAARSCRPSTSRSSTTPTFEADAESFVFTATNPGNAPERDRARAPSSTTSPTRRWSRSPTRKVVEGDIGVEDHDVHGLARPRVDRAGDGAVLDRERHRDGAGPTTPRRTTSRSSSRPARPARRSRCRSSATPSTRATRRSRSRCRRTSAPRSASRPRPARSSTTTSPSVAAPVMSVGDLSVTEGDSRHHEHQRDRVAEREADEPR